MSKKAAVPVVRGKRDLEGKTSADRLKEAEGYLAAQAQSSLGPQIATETTALKTAHDNLVNQVAAKKTIDAQATLNAGAIADDEEALDEAAGDYVRKASRVANGDAVALAGLGVSRVAARSAAGAPDAPSEVTLKAGAAQGDLTVRIKRPPGAASFVIEYKLEPSAPADPWLPPGGIQTSHATYTLSGLPAAQAVRVRAQGIGASPGAWSAEVIGRAR